MFGCNNEVLREWEGWVRIKTEKEREEVVQKCVGHDDDVMQPIAQTDLSTDDGYSILFPLQILLILSICARFGILTTS